MLVKLKRISPEVIRPDALSVESNAMVAFLAGDCTVYLFPNDIFVRTAHTCRSIGKNLNVEVKSCDFREEEVHPGDSELIGSVWRYTRQDGGPDLRFSGNRKILYTGMGRLSLRAREDSGCI